MLLFKIGKLHTAKCLQALAARPGSRRFIFSATAGQAVTRRGCRSTPRRVLNYYLSGGHSMAKYQDGHYLELPRAIFTDDRFLNLSDAGKWLFLVLKELEHRYTGENEDFFYRSNEDLARDCGWTKSKLVRIKPEVVNSGLVQTWQMHWIDKNTGKKSEKHVTAFRMLV
jgi:hypothetical protein